MFNTNIYYGSPDSCHHFSSIVDVNGLYINSLFSSKTTWTYATKLDRDGSLDHVI
jgi:hypothetical protein